MDFGTLTWRGSSYGEWMHRHVFGWRDICVIFAQGPEAVRDFRIAVGKC